MNKKEFENNKVFKLQYGSLFTNNNIMIDNIGFIYDKECGCILKYGDLNRNLEQYYLGMQSKYIKAGQKEIADDIVLIKFDRYNGNLSMEEICTFSNYLVMCSANKNIVNNMLFEMTIEELKDKLKELSEIGY